MWSNLKHFIIMNRELVEDAVSQALSLLHDEVQCVIDDDLKKEYEDVIELLEKAISSIRE